jgi:hypothetical protein
MILLLKSGIPGLIQVQGVDSCLEQLLGAGTDAGDCIAVCAGEVATSTAAAGKGDKDVGYMSPIVCRWWPAFWAAAVIIMAGIEGSKLGAS